MTSLSDSYEEQLKIQQRAIAQNRQARLVKQVRKKFTTKRAKHKKKRSK